LENQEDAIHNAYIMLPLKFGERDVGDQELGFAVSQKCARGVEPGAVKVVQGDRGHPKWGEGHTGNRLIPGEYYM
jgi:hypothetical protein